MADSSTQTQRRQNEVIGNKDMGMLEMLLFDSF